MSGPALLLAPVGRDAAALGRVLAGTGIESLAFPILQQLCAALGHGTPLILLTEEGLAGGAGELEACLDKQPPWSDLPIILLAAGSGRTGGLERWRLFERLGNVTILDRPLHAGTLQSAVRAALRGRSRQYQAREHLEELREAREGLEQKVADRTRQLETEMAERRQVEAALLRAQRLEAVGQLTGGIAHDFNNLLQVVVGGISMLHRHADKPERCQRALDSMSQATDRGARLTQQLLSFARRQPLAAEVADVVARVGDMQELLRGSLRLDIEFKLELASDLWTVEVDVTQLEVALLNLVVNARDATLPGGKVTIQVANASLTSIGPLSELSGDFVRITVQDTGSGMDEATLARAFEPFFTTKAVGRGTGLGLSQVYGFGRQSGGGVQIESRPGQGTSVSLFLPKSARLLQAQHVNDGRETEQRGGRLLLVEDEQQIADLSCAMLEELGYRCEHVLTGDAALGLNIDGFDAVLSDVVMPGRTDGVALAQELRRRRPELPILLTTGFAGAPERVVSSGLPVLKKPYTLDELSAALGTVVRHRSKAAGN
ncbi:MAG TPA: ATP-binding protein [Mesorhizobium sp.]|jgi:signal transduction histidine kinase/CheY-like chemotaxis protein|nr:ATP-binding protein [Mesorhizobium sp.]